MADFKIGKIRFTWRGNWASVYDYVKDDIVRYGAKTYVCMVTHTSSADFYTDLNNVATRWNEMIDGYEWTEDWTATTFYQLNDLVKYSGIVYRCTTNHTSSTTLETNIANWTVHFSGDDWNNVWTATTFSMSMTWYAGAALSTDATLRTLQQHMQPMSIQHWHF